MNNMIKLQSLYNECVSELNSVNVPIGHVNQVTISNTKRTYGDCRREGNGYAIRISKNLLENSNTKGIKTTIIHELLHTVPDGMKHTGGWKRWATYVNNKLDYNIKRTTDPVEKGMERRKVHRLPYKYIVTCMGCGHTYRYKRNCYSIECCKNGEAWCPHCKSHEFNVDMY